MLCVTRPFDDRGCARLHAQAPYTIEVASSQYKQLLNVYNANLLSNLTAAGKAAFSVVNAYQNLQPNYNNVVEITYTVSSKSQVTPAPPVCWRCSRWSLSPCGGGGAAATS